MICKCVQETTVHSYYRSNTARSNSPGVKISRQWLAALCVAACFFSRHSALHDSGESQCESDSRHVNMNTNIFSPLQTNSSRICDLLWSQTLIIMAEIPFRIGSSVKWISGISEDTTCRDILIAVLRSEALLDCEESEVHHRFALVETWRYRTSSSHPDNNCRISYCTTIKYFSKPQLRSSENLFSSAVVNQNTATNILLASINFPTAASLWVWV